MLALWSPATALPTLIATAAIAKSNFFMMFFSSIGCQTNRNSNSRSEGG
jgi:hypothetical protein